ncbi:DUF4956 domain-containing protein [Alloiococcus sp. CFN-8]|uniref:DUF4956 domain-containing protein n=1 Tax=Alloiococcus sp. CFN-8 TaxID=3416081 RepID=UPI003CEE8638
MTFNDVFKSSFLNNIAEFSILDTTLAMVFACVVGLFIYLVYKRTFAGVMYSAGFSSALIGLTLITTFVILAVTSNVVLSLGMVGALSIVRFRAAIKEPMEIVFLFWALASGIVIGAGMIPLAVIGSLIIGIVLVVFSKRKASENPYVLVLNCDNEEAEKAAVNMLNSDVDKYVLKTKTITAQGIEISAEVRMKNASTSFISKLYGIKGVKKAVLVSYNGEYMS